MPVKLRQKSPMKDASQFFDALKDQVRNGTFCDVVLVCGDGQRIVGHKAILAASSPYFYNLFTTAELSQEPVDTMANFDTTNDFDTMAKFDTSVSPGECMKAIVKRVVSKKDLTRVFGICGIKYRHVQAMVDYIYRNPIILDNLGEDLDTFIQVAKNTFGVVIDTNTFTIGYGFDPGQRSSPLQMVGQPLITGSRRGRKREMNQAIDLSTKVDGTAAGRSSSAARLFFGRGLSSAGKSFSAARSVSAGRGRKLKGIRAASSAVGAPTSAGTIPISAGTIPTSAGTIPTSAGNDTTKHQSLEALRSLTAGHHGSMSSVTSGPMSPIVPMNHPFQSYVQQNWNPVHSQSTSSWTQGWNQNQIQGLYRSIFGQNRDQVTFVGSEEDGTSRHGHKESGNGQVVPLVKETRIKCIWEGCKKYFRSDNSMMAHLVSTHYQVILKCPSPGCIKKCTKSGTFMNHVTTHAELVEPEVMKSHLVKVIEECKRKAEEQLEALNDQEAGTENVALESVTPSKMASEPGIKKRKKKSSGVDLSRRPSPTSTTVSPTANVASSPGPSKLFASSKMTLSRLKSVPSASSVSSENGQKVIPIRGTQIDRIEYIDSEIEEEETDEEEEKEEEEEEKEEEEIGNGSKSGSRKVTSSQG